MSDIPEILNDVLDEVDDAYTDATIAKEFKTGKRSFLGLDGVSLLLIAFTIVIGIGLLLFGLAGSKLILPLVLLFVVGSIFLYGDQFMSPMEGRVLSVSEYRTGWSPAYVWFVGLVFAGLAGLLTYHWAEIPFRVSATEPFEGRFAYFAQKSTPKAQAQAKPGPSPKVAQAKKPVQSNELSKAHKSKSAQAKHAQLIRKTAKTTG